MFLWTPSSEPRLGGVARQVRFKSNETPEGAYMQLPRAVCILPAGTMFILNLLSVSGTKGKGEYGDIVYIALFTSITVNLKNNSKSPIIFGFSHFVWLNGFGRKIVEVLRKGTPLHHT